MASYPVLGVFEPSPFSNMALTPFNEFCRHPTKTIISRHEPITPTKHRVTNEEKNQTLNKRPLQIDANHNKKIRLNNI
jgi:hypothetical protein